MIQAYCVESGRWTKRGNEDSSKFSISNDRIVTKELKLAANSAKSQSEVWAKVGEAQERLSKNVGTPVASGVSSSSLQLAIENRKLIATTDEYIRHFAGIIDGRSDVIGYAFAINGKVNSADVYASNALFKNLWMKMLRATATEAVAGSRDVRLADPVKADAVRSFMDDADKAEASETTVGPRSKIISREDKDNAVFEARDEKQKVTIHKSYVKKQ